MLGQRKRKCICNLALASRAIITFWCIVGAGLVPYAVNERVPFVVNAYRSVTIMYNNLGFQMVPQKTPRMAANKNARIDAPPGAW